MTLIFVTVRMASNRYVVIEFGFRLDFHTKDDTVTA